MILGNVHVSEKSEQVAMLEAELDPMSYDKVFRNDKYIVNRPRPHLSQPKRIYQQEYFESQAFKEHQERCEQRQSIADTHSLEKVTQLTRRKTQTKVETVHLGPKHRRGMRS